MNLKTNSSSVHELSPQPLTLEATNVSDHIAKPFLPMRDMTGSLVCSENEIPIDWPGFPGIFVHPPYLLRSILSKNPSASRIYHEPSAAFLTNLSFES